MKRYQLYLEDLIIGCFDEYYPLFRLYTINLVEDYCCDIDQDFEEMMDDSDIEIEFDGSDIDYGDDCNIIGYNENDLIGTAILKQNGFKYECNMVCKFNGSVLCDCIDLRSIKKLNY